MEKTAVEEMRKVPFALFIHQLALKHLQTDVYILKGI